MKRQRWFLSLVFIFSQGLFSKSLESYITNIPASLMSNKIMIATYNLENLFDTIHDKNKKDWTYLPLKDKIKDRNHVTRCLTQPQAYMHSCFYKDWNNDSLTKKLTNMGKVIKEMNQGLGPDILVLQEVENMNVLSMLVEKELQGLGYDYISLLEGADARGIDVAILSKYEIMAEKIYPHSFLKEKEGEMKRQNSRPILEAVIKVQNKTIVVLANHWPSQANPSVARVAAAEMMRDIALGHVDNVDLVVATGDFNTINRDNPHPYKGNGFSDTFVDAEAVARLLKSDLNEGTHWYRGTWSSLDKIFIASKSLEKKKLITNWQSFDIFKRSFMVKNFNYKDRDTGISTHHEGVPKRFSSRTGDGYSDHLPVTLNFHLAE
ncbi:endonuclease/exonuclease/phosphatase family protein [Bacteriovoracaceae bacterium]|nr:endonuclease/exonuclease/phosphatase family protein [Bacteriovoracaceae bacterium]